MTRSLATNTVNIFWHDGRNDKQSNPWSLEFRGAVLGVGILDGARPSPLFDKWPLTVAGHGPTFSHIDKCVGVDLTDRALFVGY